MKKELHIELEGLSEEAVALEIASAGNFKEMAI